MRTVALHLFLWGKRENSAFIFLLRVKRMDTIRLDMEGGK